MLRSGERIEIGRPSSEQLYHSLRRQRWLLLGTGLILGLLLVLLQVGVIPGVLTGDSTEVAIAIYAVSGFVVMAGVISWWLWTRIAETRTKSATLTPEGVELEFFGGSTTSLNWTDRELRLRLREFSDSDRVQGATLEWGSGRMGQYASISRVGAAHIKEEAVAHGLKLASSTTGTAPNQWTLTKISH